MIMVVVVHLLTVCKRISPPAVVVVGGRCNDKMRHVIICRTLPDHSALRRFIGGSTEMSLRQVHRNGGGWASSRRIADEREPVSLCGQHSRFVARRHVTPEASAGFCYPRRRYYMSAIDR